MTTQLSVVLTHVLKEVVSNNHGFFFFFYIFLSKNGPCRYDPKYSAANATGFVKIPVSEDVLMKAVATVGPISVGIDSHHHSFRFYKGGKCASFQ